MLPEYVEMILSFSKVSVAKTPNPAFFINDYFIYNVEY